eukprot:CAMPEP_0194446606 /NCGR_PEP_ID=MMETSP0176-20130528/128531_1 /TAXON_ID=216777 /ORGANISM="Proboscia alata, Strain PI-D3" /LENGTH=584 /DNA_ID=CAMNT_0039273343 /DNA_START=57 /DNA_END=1812 /DNA_ORIENTATION=+
MFDSVLIKCLLLVLLMSPATSFVNLIRRDIRSPLLIFHGSVNSNEGDDDENNKLPSSGTAVSSVAEREEDNSSCPISMKFPRYRIDFSSNPTIPVGKRNNKKRDRISSFFGDIKTSFDVSQIEQKYQNDISSGSFRWVESYSIELSAENKNDESIQSVLNDARGVFLSVMFWECIADLSSSSSPYANNNRLVLSTKSIPGGDYDGMRQMMQGLVDIYDWYVNYMSSTDGGDYDGMRQMMQGLVDIYDWYVNYMSSTESTGEIALTRVSCSIDRESSLPAIIFTRPGSFSTKSENTAKNDVSSLVIENRIKSWVRRLLVKLSICPFTKSVSRSGQGLSDVGVPVGRISYHHSRANGFNEVPKLLRDTWHSIAEMTLAGPGGSKGISSILLAAPAYDDHFRFWAGPIFAMLESNVSAVDVSHLIGIVCFHPKYGPIFAMLESNVSAVDVSHLIGIVCFHPKYATPDSRSWPGFGHMHSVPRLAKWVEQYAQTTITTEDDTIVEEAEEVLSEDEIAAGGAWQRRTPHAVINILRAEQLEAAEGKRVTGRLYARNILTLAGKEENHPEVTFEKLASDLKQEQQMQDIK